MAAEPVHHNPIFEGSEKRVEIDFRLGAGAAAAGLRAVPRETIDELMALAHCCVVSNRSNEQLDAYVLSESSLFVYPTKWVLKTCGTTRLLASVPRLLEVAAALGLEPRRCKYTRASFLFPKNQVGFWLGRAGWARRRRCSLCPWVVGGLWAAALGFWRAAHGARTAGASPVPSAGTTERAMGLPGPHIAHWAPCVPAQPTSSFQAAAVGGRGLCARSLAAAFRLRLSPDPSHPPPRPSPPPLAASPLHVF